MLYIQKGEYFIINSIKINYNNNCQYKYFLLTFDDNYVGVAVSLIKSVIVNTSEKLCFIIFSNKFNQDSMSKLEALNIPIIIYNIGDESIRYNHNNWPIESTFRLIAPWIIEEEMDYLYYLDADILCISRLDDLFKIQFDQSIAMCTEFFANSYNICEKYGNDYLYNNSGFIIYNMNQFKKKYNMLDIIEKFNEINDNLKYPDQDFLNIYFANDIKPLNPFKYNNLMFDLYKKFKKNELNFFLKNTIFLHFFGENKPWASSKDQLFRYNVYLKYSNDEYMSKMVKKYKKKHIFHYPFVLIKKIFRKIYRIIFRKNK